MAGIKDIHHSTFVRMINERKVKVELPTKDKETVYVQGAFET